MPTDLTTAAADHAHLMGQLQLAFAKRPRLEALADDYAAAAVTHNKPELHLADVDLALDVAGIDDRETNVRNILGDHGHGHGEGQIDDRFHEAWLKAHDNGLDPRSNIDETTDLYVSGLLVIYNHEIVAGRKRTLPQLRRFGMAAYNCGVQRVVEALDRGEDPDIHTTAGPTGHGDYGADTWRRREEFAAELAAATGAGGVCA